MNQAEQILLAKEYMYQFHKNDYSGHDIAHIERVTSLAKYIAKQEHQGDFLTIVLSALLHDVIDDKLTDKHHALSELYQFFKKIKRVKLLDFLLTSIIIYEYLSLILYFFYIFLFFY